MRKALATVLLGLALIFAALVFVPTDGLLSKDPPSIQAVSLSHVLSELDAAKAEGQVAVLYIWASWCPACTQSLPNVDRLVRKWESDDVRILIVSVDRELAELERMLKLTGAEFEPLCIPAVPDGKLDAALVARGAKPSGAIPYGVVFDRQGAVYRQWTGWVSMDAWNGTMEELL